MPTVDLKRLLNKGISSGLKINEIVIYSQLGDQPIIINDKNTIRDLNIELHGGAIYGDFRCCSWRQGLKGIRAVRPSIL